MTQDQAPVIAHWVDGKVWEGAGERTSPVYDPATGAVAATVRLASTADVDAAVASAVAAASEWRHASLSRRTQVLFAFRELVHAHRDDLAAVLTAQHGKVTADALGEVAPASRWSSSPAASRRCSRAVHSEQVSTDVDVHSVRQPLGVVAGITPFNFPAMVPMWMSPWPSPAATRSCSSRRRRTRRRRCCWPSCGAGRPARRRVQRRARRQGGRGPRCSTTPTCAAVSFVGSTPIARYVYERGTAHGKRVQALGGAKNHMVVLPDADLDLAADAAVSAGFGSAGERCMAISVVVAVDPIGDDLVARIADRIRACSCPRHHARRRDGAAGHRAHRPAGRRLRRRGRGRGRRSGGGRAGAGGRRSRGRLLLGPTCSTTCAGHVDHRGDLRPGPVGRAGGVVRGGGRLVAQPWYGNGVGDLHQRRRRGPAVPERGRGRHGGHQRADPGADGVLLLRRLEGARCSATPTPTAPRACTSTPGARW